MSECLYCDNLDRFDLLPAETIMIFDDSDPAIWRTLASHSEKHPVNARPHFYIPCKSGINSEKIK